MTQRDFAIEVIQTLQRAGHVALLAGGCVRDELRGVPPKDYDVATSARPDEVRELFGQRRTLAVGATFGVIVVLGRNSGEQIEVATFRKDVGYSDGRRPDRVEFTDAQGDAMRRDFSINGMFLDPLREEVLDYVGGRNDLEMGVVRAIGDPNERIAEDKLRMLRGVRFAALLAFQLDAPTARAIRDHAAEIQVVSGERIGAEMRLMLTHPRRAFAAQLLADCHLLPQIIDDGQLLLEYRGSWNCRLRWLDELGQASFEEAAAVWLGPLVKRQGIEPLARRWRLSLIEQKSIRWLESHWLTVTRASRLPWSQVQPVLAHPLAPQAVHIAATVAGDHQPGVAAARAALAWPSDKLDPPPLVNGGDLMRLGIPGGPKLGQMIAEIRRAQLDGELTSKEAALEWAQEQRYA